MHGPAINYELSRSERTQNNAICPGYGKTGTEVPTIQLFEYKHQANTCFQIFLCMICNISFYTLQTHVRTETLHLSLLNDIN